MLTDITVVVLSKEKKKQTQHCENSGDKEKLAEVY